MLVHIDNERSNMPEHKKIKEDEEIFEPLYLRERHKTKYLLISTVMLGILFLGALVINPGSSNANPNTQTGENQGGADMGRQGMSITAFFNEDGSLNQARVDKLDLIPAQRKEKLISRIDAQIDNGVNNGVITSEQATTLKEALGIE